MDAAADADAQRSYLRLCAAGSLAYLSYAMCRSPLLPLFARHLGAGPALVGLAAGASTVTGIFLKLPAGTLSDVFGRAALLTAGAAVFALLPFTYLAIASLGALIALRVVHGSATAIFGPVASATLSDLAPPDRRGTWLGAYASIQGAGQALGPVVAGYLILGSEFDRAFVASGLVGAAAFALVARWPRDASAGHAAPNRWSEFRRGVTEVARHRPILTTSLAQAGQFLLHGSLAAFLPLYACEQLGLDTFQIGLLLGVQTITTLVSRPAFGALSDQVGRRPMIAAGLSSSGVAVWLVSLASNGAVLTAVVAAYGVSVGVTTAATNAYITDLSRRARYGAAHGVFGTIYDIGDASGPLAGGVLVAAAGYQPMFRTMGTIALALAAAFTWLSRDWQRN